MNRTNRTNPDDAAVSDALIISQQQHLARSHVHRNTAIGRSSSVAARSSEKRDATAALHMAERVPMTEFCKLVSPASETALRARTFAFEACSAARLVFRCTMVALCFQKFLQKKFVRPRVVK